MEPSVVQDFSFSLHTLIHFNISLTNNIAIAILIIFAISIISRFICCFYFFKDSPDIIKDTQKKSKRKGRNRQEVVTPSKIEPEPEAVKTPVDERRVSAS